MPVVLIILGACFLFFGVLELRSAWRLFSAGRSLSGGISTVSGLLLLTFAVLAGTITVATRGYHRLTQEDLAATVKTEPLSHQQFRATIILAGGKLAMYDLLGDVFYVDARIVKWHRLVNFLGLHTAYELDRVTGRYNDVGDERTKPHMVYALSRPRTLDMLRLVKLFPPLSLLVDAEYGSATFTTAPRPASFNVLVSPTGLLIRPTD